MMDCYAVLGVGSGATEREIAAAWRAQCRRWHPDFNPGDPAAMERMFAINQAYHTLSDAGRRRDYDAGLAAPAVLVARPRPDLHPAEVAAPMPDRRRLALLGLSIAGAVGVAVAAIVFVKPMPPKAEGRLFAPGHAAQPVAPNGANWPTGAGYVDGYPRPRGDGGGTITVENAANPNDVYVRLVSLDGFDRPTAHLFVPGGRRFRVERVVDGRYTLHSRDLSDGSETRTDAFSIDPESREVTLTLSAVTPGPSR